MAVKVSYVQAYKDYGRCVRLENGLLEALITVDIGPRIIYMGVPGGENLLFNDDNHVRVTKDEVFEMVFGKGEEYHFYGGLRLWLAPQLPVHTNEPDNSPVAHTLFDNGVALYPAAHKLSGMRPAMTVMMAEDEARLDVRAEFTNVSDTAKQYAPWIITQFDVGGLALAPFAPERRPFKVRGPGDPLPKLSELLKPIKPSVMLVQFIGGVTDKRFGLDDRYLTLAQDCDARTPYKIGTPNREGWAMYANKGQVVTVQYPCDPEGTYTDGGCSFEAYTDALFIELESLGRFETVEPGGTLVHTQSLTVQPMKGPLPDPADRKAVAEFIGRHK